MENFRQWSTSKGWKSNDPSKNGIESRILDSTAKPYEKIEWCVGDLPPAKYIGLQDHSTPNNVYFRNVRIQKLKNLVPAGGI